MATDGGQDRKASIIEAAAEIFWERGYNATSMGELAVAAGLAQSSLYHHFDGKETMLYEMSESSLQNITAAALAVTPDEPEAYLRKLIGGHIEALLHDRSRHAVALVELRSLSAGRRASIVEMRTRYDQLIEDAVRAVQESTGRWAGMPTAVVRLAILGMLNWTVFWYRADGPESAESLGGLYAQIILPE